MRFRTPALTFVSACLLLASLPTQPALADPTQDQLSSQHQAAQSALVQLQADYNSKNADYQKALAQAQKLSTEITAMDGREKLLQQQHDDRINRFRSQTRSLYKAGPAEALVFLFGADSFSNFLDRLFYITAITRDNLDQAQVLRYEREALLRERARTARLKADLDPLLAQLAARVAEAAGLVRSMDAEKSQIESQQRALAAAAAAAAAAAKKGAGLAYGAVCPAAPPGTISFCGHGLGHGVGLAQYGALGMAQAGMDWPQIIHNFYSGVSIGPIPDQTVRVYLASAGGNIVARFSGANVEDAAGNPLGLIGQDQTVGFSRNGDGSISASWAGGSARAPTLRLVPAGGAFQVSGSGTRYRGEAWVDGGGGFKVINHVELETYLRGLAEVPSSWPVQAIAAQIVAARSYALYHLGGGPYDVDDTTSYQVYGGLDRETASQNSAVDGTRLQGILSNNQVIDAVFSSSDGGHTQCASAEWGSTDNPCTPPYLSGLLDNYDVSPLHTWYTPAHTPGEIQGYLGSAYNAGACGNLTAFDLSSRDASDRLNTVRMVGSRGVCTTTPGAFIRAINAGSPGNFVVYGELLGVTPGNRAWPYW